MLRVLNNARGAPLARSRLGVQRARLSATSTDVSKLVAEASGTLPSQAILENFVHANPLKPFEHMQFDEAIDHVHHLDSGVSAGARFFELMGTDPRVRVNTTMSDLGATFCDRGSARWTMRNRDKGFLHFFASTESLGFAPWRSDARLRAKELLADFEKADALFNGLDGEAYSLMSSDVTQNEYRAIAERHLIASLDRTGVAPADRVTMMRASMLELKGWAGMFKYMEDNPAFGPSCDGRVRVAYDETTGAPEFLASSPAKTRLVDFMCVRSLLMESSIQSMAGVNHAVDLTPTKQPFVHNKPAKPVKSAVSRMPQHPSGLSHANQSQAHLRDSLEVKYKNALVRAIGTRNVPAPNKDAPALQVWTCIDDRSEGLRRALENESADVETLGVAGFFGVPVVLKPLDGREIVILAPPGSKPAYQLVEKPHPDDESKMSQRMQMRRYLGTAMQLREDMTFSPLLSLLSSVIWAPISAVNMFLIPFPHAAAGWKGMFEKLFVPEARTTFDIPFPVNESAKMVATVLTDIGTKDRMAPLILTVGHRSSSTNNPYFAAYQCGACQGREGFTSARLFARMANDPEVRALVESEHGIKIPDGTHFVGGGHNTSMETVELFDLDDVPASHHEAVLCARRSLDSACELHALERSHKFFMNTHDSPKAALACVQTRAVDPREVRPELNHATNAGVIVGRRDLTKGQFLDRRPFMLSYDPFTDDERGTSLERILRPALVVCSGINLEYYFSTAFPDHSAGTKVPLNIVGIIGVMQGTAGDLRTGLPTQMTEMHTPIRAQYVVDAPVARVQAVLARDEALTRIVQNDWVGLTVRDPFTNEFFEQKNGEYIKLDVNSKTKRRSMTSADDVDFKVHRDHGLETAAWESGIYRTAQVGMVGAAVAPVAGFYDVIDYSAPYNLCFDGIVAHPQGAIIAACATALSMPTLSFARRYLHGEFMFARFSALSVALLGSFNVIATAPALSTAFIAGFSSFGFASTFLIGMYNERQTVRDNATFAFASYRLGDLGVLTAAAFAPLAGAAVAVTPAISTGLLAGVDPGAIVAGGLITGAFFKSSQFPLATLFARSMEGPTPSSALGYAGLSAHVGVVMLACNTDLWFDYDVARAIVFGGGALTMVTSTLVAKTTADRKGSIAYATSATLGQIFMVLACGYADAALLLSLCHAAYRVDQTLQSPNLLAEKQTTRAALGCANTATRDTTWTPPQWLFDLAWRAKRFDRDMVDTGADIFGVNPKKTEKVLGLSRGQQIAATAGVVTCAGLPLTPLSHGIEHVILDFMPTNPVFCAALGLSHCVMSVVLMRFLFTRILDPSRFNRDHDEKANVGDEKKWYEGNKSPGIKW